MWVRRIDNDHAHIGIEQPGVHRHPVQTAVDCPEQPRRSTGVDRRRRRLRDSYRLDGRRGQTIADFCPCAAGVRTLVHTIRIRTRVNRAWVGDRKRGDKNIGQTRRAAPRVAAVRGLHDPDIRSPTRRVHRAGRYRIRCQRRHAVSWKPAEIRPCNTAVRAPIYAAAPTCDVVVRRGIQYRGAGCSGTAGGHSNCGYRQTADIRAGSRPCRAAIGSAEYGTAAIARLHRIGGCTGPRPIQCGSVARNIHIAGRINSDRVGCVIIVRSPRKSSP